MSKKSFTSAAKSNQDAFNAIAAGGQNNTPATPSTSSPQTALDAEATYDTPNVSAISDAMNASATQSTHATSGTPDNVHLSPQIQYTKFNLRMPIEMKSYLEKAAFAKSTPVHIVSVTQYLCDLIQKDMEENAGRE